MPLPVAEGRRRTRSGGTTDRDYKAARLYATKGLYESLLIGFSAWSCILQVSALSYNILISLPRCEHDASFHMLFLQILEAQ